MVDPRLALLVFAAIAALALAVAWPRRGIAARVSRLLRISERVRAEDALKYLYHRGATGDAVHADALSGVLQVRRTFSRELLERLTERGLVSASGTGYRLTDDGRAEALRIVRSHRLLERYLADRTGIGPEEWHEVAEAREHEMTPVEVEALAARLGQPRYDPHGDPIPTATGELPKSEWMLLPALAPGNAGLVVHLEDEPAEAFERLVAMGFALGKSLVVHARTGSRTELELDGATLTIPRALEEAVSVTQTLAHTTARPRTLADLAMGETGRVLRISSNCRGAQRRRLLDLGVVPGTGIESELRSASGDPTAYRIRGALIALRRQQAAWIEIEDAADARTGSSQAA
jgi:DtxR family Mn-dependent transcriptional regulator